MSPLRTGQMLHHYRILDRIGRGGMGEVYAAEDVKLSRRVAIKLLPTTSRHNDQSRVRLLREARSASALNHPNIVTIYSIDEVDEHDFLVMEYVEGETLAATLKRGPLGLAPLLEVGAQVAEGLAVAHAARIIHRDVKPANILVTPAGRAKILDFGLARPIEGMDTDDSDGTRTGVICGTVAYMSPEQTRSEPLDERTDVFSKFHRTMSGGFQTGTSSRSRAASHSRQARECRW